MIDVAFVHPGGASGIYGPLAGDLAAIEPPMWARLLAAHARSHGHSAAIIDAEAEGLDAAGAMRRVEVLDPRLVVLVAFGHQPSASTQMMPAARAIAHAINARMAVPMLIVGGHVSALPERTLREEPVRYACVGEGPHTVDALLRDEPLDAVPGLVWHKDGCVAVNKRAPAIHPSHLKGDAWDLLPMGRYRAHNWQCLGSWPRAPYASIYTSLGCPYSCTFCCINAPFGKPGYRMRDPDEVVTEIGDLYYGLGVRTFKIVDELFVLNDKHVSEICERLVASGLGDVINVWAYARTDTVKPARLALMRRAGIRWLALGIESANAAVRAGVDKSLRGDVGDAVRAIQDAGINVIGNYIFGLPDDDGDSMRATLDLALALRTEFANFYTAMAYPGSRLYDEAVASGATLPDNWSGYSQHSYDCRPLDTKHVGATAVLKFRDEAFKAYFTDASYLSRVRAKFGRGAVDEITAMVARPLSRRLLEAA